MNDAGNAAHTSRWPLLFAEGIRAAAGRQPDKIAIRVVDQGKVTETIDYAHFVRRMNQVSHLALNELGLTRGDHVAIASPNALHYMLLLCGLGAVGIVAATPNPNLSPREIGAICNDAQARVLFCRYGSGRTAARTNARHGRTHSNDGRVFGCAIEQSNRDIARPKSPSRLIRRLRAALHVGNNR